MAYLTKANIISIHDSVVTWRKELEVLKYICYPSDKSIPSISTTCSTITTQSSTSFKASSSLQVIAKPSPGMSKLARRYKDFKIPSVRLAACLILARIISRDLISRLSSI
jgi:hypothetical protein